MILTDKFVYVHQPKTGGTFVEHVLSTLFKKRSNFIARLTNSLLNRPRSFIDINKHGTCSEIPTSHKSKPILATIRNPYDRYVSQFEFGWWRNYPESFCNVNEIQKLYPHFPDISFEEFVLLSNALFLKLKNGNIGTQDSPGWQTEQFVRYFFKKPADIFPLIDQNYICSKKYRIDMFSVSFMKTDRLNQDIYFFLLKLGYAQDELRFILDLKKIFPPEGGRSEEQTWQKYYTPSLKNMVRKKEKLLFNMFPEFDNKD